MSETDNARPSAIDGHIETIAALERQSLEQRNRAEHMGDLVAGRIGSMPMLVAHAVWLSMWIIVNLGGIPGLQPFDPFPFSFLGLLVSVEAVFLSLFLLLSQNRMTRQSDRRAHLDLQVSLLIETEVTQMLRVLERVSVRLGVDLSDDPELKELIAITDVHGLVQSLQEKIPDANGTAPSPAVEAEASADR